MDLTEHFSVVHGEIVAVNPARVFEALRHQFDETLVLQVQAMSSPDAGHTGRSRFAWDSGPLSVRLEAPPSNRALSVANIEVGISMFGAGIAVQRVCPTRTADWKWHRRALAVAGDDAKARRLVAEVIDRMGYDPVDAGSLVAATRNGNRGTLPAR